jgi:hypothetical protein
MTLGVIKEKLDKIRPPKTMTRKKDVAVVVLVLCLGIVLGIISKYLDALGLDSTVWWHRPLEILDLGNFFSDFAIWLLIALLIAVFSATALRAALNVLAFFVGMCAAYHIYTVVFCGFNPSSYMMIWYGITILSPIMAVLCWYAKGSGAVAVILDIGIMAVFFLSCFSIGFFYLAIRGILYLLTFAGAVAVLYRTPKQIIVSLLGGFLLSFLLSPVWIYL